MLKKNMVYNWTALLTFHGLTLCNTYSLLRRLERQYNWSLTTYCKWHWLVLLIWDDSCSLYFRLPTFSLLASHSNSLLLFTSLQEPQLKTWRRLENAIEYHCITSSWSWGRIVNQRRARSHSYSSRWEVDVFLTVTQSFLTCCHIPAFSFVCW